ncbi:methyltransferase domain-containing protein [Breoghania sp.]|uniref:methyltransferase domain-containing protein n=1 Tax=Breoghania sp. TaxID=2065378 RepID=UPI00261EC667|nr:methyltransferase domain-containing protein [Breoghania sp.]MDJ0932550.1 methyltransferase domain-containing protein [Breoghania sp.]
MPMNSPFNRRLLALHRARALAQRTEGADFLLRLVAQDIEDRLAVTTHKFALALDLGGHTGQVRNALERSDRVETVLRADLFVPDQGSGKPDLVVDDEILPFADGSLDLVVSALSLHWVNDLPGALIQIRRALKPDGLFLGALADGDTLWELRDALLSAEAELTGGASPRVSPFADTREMGGLLQRAGFALPVADQDRLTVRYDSAFHLMRDLRAMGATGILAERGAPASRALFMKTVEIYAERHADPDGRIRATFQILSVSGWAPHESQQQPLKPGSAKMSFAEALGTNEIATGDKPSRT